jgi:hypothetical protein
LWSEAGAIDRLDKNWVYGMHIALTQDTRVSHSVLMVGTQHSDFKHHLPLRRWFEIGFHNNWLLSCTI